MVGSRGSKLALIQAEEVLTRLRESNPEFEFVPVQVTTEGDRERAVPLDRMEGVGIFVKELEEALLDSRIDLAIHSLKDMPTGLPPGLSLAAVGARLDPRDALVSRKGTLTELASGSRVGTGSPRRAVQLLSCRSDLEVHSIRGNVDTRLGKVWSGDFDGVVVAAAALIRLGCEEVITEYLPPDYFLPAAGQGALGIEIRSEDKEMARLASTVNHQPTWYSVIAERVFLYSLGGGCRAPIAALGTIDGNMLQLEGMVASASDQRIIRCSERGSTSSPEQVGMRLAERILEMGASEFIAEARV